jgi:site-specific DNA-methyltransferase (adenine-specific)
MWVFGSLRFFMATAERFADAGWRYAQDIVWEKHNGSGFQADRFKRVHELAVQFYPDDVAWNTVWNEVQTTRDAEARKTIRRRRPPHMGQIDSVAYQSETGGPRLMRSVIAIRSCHHEAIHPTEKPVGLIQILVRTSCPPDGVVGDFFAGSGAAGEACAHAARRYVGSEVDPEMAARALARLRGNMFA